MNTQQESANLEESTWVGVSYVTPVKGSFQERRGLKGGYGFVAFRDNDICGGISALADELKIGGTRLTGFEWLSRLQDNEHELTDLDYTLIERLDKYPVQFAEIHWFTEE